MSALRPPSEPEGEHARVEALQREVDRLRTTIERIEASEAFRIGHLVTRFAGRFRRGRRAPSGPPPPSAPADVPAAPQLTVPAGIDGLAEGHATTLIVLWGLDDAQVEAAVADVAALQRMRRHFKPLFVTDSDHAEPFRRHGYAFEHIPSRADWTRHRPAAEWRDYVDTRMGWLLATYHPTRTVVFEHPERRDALRHGVLDRVIGR